VVDGLAQVATYPARAMSALKKRPRLRPDKQVGVDEYVEVLEDWFRLERCRDIHKMMQPLFQNITWKVRIQKRTYKS
jgi:hypothetical protein